MSELCAGGGKVTANRPAGLPCYGASMTAPLSRPTPGRILLLLSLAELMGMSPWFAGAAMAPQLAARWSLDPAQVGALTSAVQL